MLQVRIAVLLQIDAFVFNLPASSSIARMMWSAGLTTGEQLYKQEHYSWSQEPEKLPFGVVSAPSGHAIIKNHDLAERRGARTVRHCFLVH
jgi:hypothetical protein